MSLFAELSRRKVFRLGAVYLAVAWLAEQAASIAFPAFEAPAWALRTPGRVWLAVLLGDMHGQSCFRALMQKHGIDVVKEPFAFNRGGAPKAGG